MSETRLMPEMEYSNLVNTMFACFMTFLNSFWPDVIHITEHLSIIDSANGLARNKMIHVSLINSLEHISLIS